MPKGVRRTCFDTNCVQCKKPISTMHTAPLTHCDDCASERDRKKRSEAATRFASRRNRDRPNYQRELKFGLKRGEVARMAEAQDGRCAICWELLPPRFAVDHDHSCCPGKKSCGRCVRALLCPGCNFGLAQFDDNPWKIRRAATYLEARKTVYDGKGPKRTHAVGFLGGAPVGR